MFLLFLSRACAELSSSLLLTPSHQKECTRRWEQTRLGQLTPSDPRDIPQKMLSVLAHKAEGRSVEGTFGVMTFVYPINCNMSLMPAFLRMAELPMGSGECVPSFAFFACTAFAFSVNLSLSQPTSCLTFTHPIL